MSPIPYAEETYSILGLKVAAMVWGSPELRPLIALHGWLDNAASFIGLVPFLSRFRIIALDLPGHGHSDHKPDGVAYHTLDWVVDVVRVIDRLRLDRFSLIGHSMGAGIASRIAGTLPERVDALVMLEGMGFRPVQVDHIPVHLATYIKDSDKFTKIPRRRRPFSFDVAVRAKKGASKMTDHAAAALIRRGIQEVQGGYLLRSDPRLQYWQPRHLTERQNEAFLRRIQCPVLSIHASHGMPVDPKLLESRKKCFTDLRIVEVPGGHHVHLDEPQSVAPHIAAFLELSH